METKINIIFRSCDVVNAVHNAPRPFDLDKKTLIKICFKSLHNAIKNYNYSITILGDNLSEEMKSFFKEFDVNLIEGIFGNDESIRQTIKIAEQFNDEEWVYFCEDDYLHRPETFQYIIDLIENRDSVFPASIKIKKLLRKREITLLSLKRFFKKPAIVIHPCDYPDRYKFQYLTKNFIFLSRFCHWRQVSDTTFTFLMQVKDVKRKKNILLKSSNSANDRYLSKNLYGTTFFFKKLLCVSPIPSLSTHMHIETMSPLFDWEKLKDKLLKEI
ncbi:hypothetical protein NAT47_03510 [Flavobacterium sp. HXWNR69]|jgi:hypothetical protein|uniref:Glycosyl transferase family 2 n=1 Tax=Flavobacterium fragile TaxID=2949085 RepID=A0ABT0TER8_9FLAO|nr:hypothetical protein [Flavobacterium sp. HXWNR69]MCL9769475.1 hypothetical protein [Flavobacterium sp. HXWNR69]